MNMRDGFAYAVMLAVEDATETGWSRDLSKREDIYKHFQIVAPSLAPQEEVTRDPMLAPPSDDPMADLAELRAAMQGKPVKPPTD